MANQRPLGVLICGSIFIGLSLLRLLSLLLKLVSRAPIIPAELYGAAWAAGVLVLAIFLIRLKPWAHKLLVLFCLLQVGVSGWSVAQVLMPKGHFYQVTFQGYVQGYQERQAKEAAAQNQPAPALDGAKLDELEKTFHDKAWPLARRPLLFLGLIPLVLHGVILIYLTLPPVRKKFQNKKKDAGAPPLSGGDSSGSAQASSTKGML